jgi:hypothetical protein
MIPAICTACGHEHKYPGNKGSRIAKMACVRCGSVRTLARAGRRPGASARAAIKAWGWVPKGAPGTR